MSVDSEVIQSINNLRPNSDWSVFVKYLRDYLDGLKNETIYAPTPERVLVVAAMARSINEVIKTIDKAPETIRQLKGIR